jgi:hypothetical protein
MLRVRSYRYSRQWMLIRGRHYNPTPCWNRRPNLHVSKDRYSRDYRRNSHDFLHRLAVRASQSSERVKGTADTVPEKILLNRLPVKPAAASPCRYSAKVRGAGDAAGVAAAFGALPSGEAVLGNDIGDAQEPTVGRQHAEGFGGSRGCQHGSTATR